MTRMNNRVSSNQDKVDNDLTQGMNNLQNLIKEIKAKQDQKFLDELGKSNNDIKMFLNEQLNQIKVDMYQQKKDLTAFTENGLKQ